MPQSPRRSELGRPRDSLGARFADFTILTDRANGNQTLWGNRYDTVTWFFVRRITAGQRRENRRDFLTRFNNDNIRGKMLSFLCGKPYQKPSAISASPKVKRPANSATVRVLDQGVADDLFLFSA